MMEALRIVIGSPIDYDELVAYIWIKGREVGLIHQEGGKNSLKVKLYSDLPELDLALFVEGLQRAKEALLGDAL